MALVNLQTLAFRINSSDMVKATIITTGGGSGIFPALLEAGGGSNTLLAGIIPYSIQETINILGGVPDKAVSLVTARSLAMAAYQKSLKLKEGGYDVVGIACSASLQRVPSEREGREHQVHVALQAKDWAHCSSLTFNKYEGLSAESVRKLEEDIVTAMIMNELALGCGLNDFYPIDRMVGDFTQEEFHSKELGEILSGERKYSVFLNGVVLPDGVIENNDNYALLPGSFNPFHEGHAEMLKIVSGKTGKKCLPEISLVNADKPATDFISIRDRLRKMGRPTVITNAPTFVNKSQVFPGISFIVGHGAYLRILNPKYAGSIDHVCSIFTGNRNYFYIFPRSGKIEGLWGTEDVVLPGEFITEHREYENLSSTNLRKS